MLEDLITGVIYTEFHDELGPNPKVWTPSSLSQNIQMLVAVKTITMLTGEEHILPKDIVVIPFPSLNSKGLVKYIEWKDETRRGGLAKAAITILFNELDDSIFYKYNDDLKPLFDGLCSSIAKFEALHVDNAILREEISNFHSKVKMLLEDLRKKELVLQKADAFPEEEGKSEFEYRFKIVVIGDPSVGKSSTILRFTHNAFTRTYMPTIGVSISEKNIKIGKKNILFILWDIAGQSKFETMRKHFYQGAEGALLVFDLTLEKSFQSILNWYKDVKKNVQTNKFVGILIGNKSDLINERKVKKEDALILAQELKLDYIEISALSGENVNQTFFKMAETLIK